MHSLIVRKRLRSQQWGLWWGRLMSENGWRYCFLFWVDDVIAFTYVSLLTVYRNTWVPWYFSLLHKSASRVLFLQSLRYLIMIDQYSWLRVIPGPSARTHTKFSLIGLRSWIGDGTSANQDNTRTLEQNICHHIYALFCSYNAVYYYMYVRTCSRTGIVLVH